MKWSPVGAKNILGAKNPATLQEIPLNSQMRLPCRNYILVCVKSASSVKCPVLLYQEPAYYAQRRSRKVVVQHSLPDTFLSYYEMVI